MLDSLSLEMAKGVSALCFAGNEFNIYYSINSLNNQYSSLLDTPLSLTIPNKNAIIYIFLLENTAL
jgi:hypothetical protein